VNLSGKWHWWINFKRRPRIVQPTASCAVINYTWTDHIDSVLSLRTVRVGSNLPMTIAQWGQYRIVSEERREERFHNINVNWQNHSLNLDYLLLVLNYTIKVCFCQSLRACDNYVSKMFVEVHNVACLAAVLRIACLSYIDACFISVYNIANITANICAQAKLALSAFVFFACGPCVWFIHLFM